MKRARYKAGISKLRKLDVHPSWYQPLVEYVGELEGERKELRKACGAALSIITEMIMRGMPVTNRVAGTRNLLAAALARDERHRSALREAGHRQLRKKHRKQEDDAKG